MLEMNVGMLIDNAVAKHKEKIAIKMADESVTYSKLKPRRQICSLVYDLVSLTFKVNGDSDYDLYLPE